MCQILLAGLAENDARVLRGGAFNNNERNVRCAYRNRNNPNNEWNNSGFRVVVVSPMLLWRVFRFNLLPQAGNAGHSRMTAEAEIREIARSSPG